MYNTLNEEQSKVVELIESGENVFITGDAGTGKSFLLDQYIENNKDKNILVCAPTGVAALNVKGTTIHRAFGLPTHPQINSYITKCSKVVREADLVIIDEISMCRIDIFDFIVRTLNYKKLDTGRDTQLIVVGDFFQLPPVITPDDREVLQEVYPNLAEGYAFESKLWAACNFKTAILTQVMRQDEAEFKNNLNKARIGDVSCIPYFNQCVNREVENPIYLTALNKEAAQINKEKLEELDTEELRFRASITGDISSNEMPTDEKLVLKVGARIMCLINDPDGDYVNGSLGTITGYIEDNSIEVQLDSKEEGDTVFISYHDFEYYDYEVIEKFNKDGASIKKLEKKVRGVFSQLPVKLSYAITIHKSQGQTYDSVLISPRTFTYGQEYVALSRCRSFDKLSLQYPITIDYLKTSPKVLDFYNIATMTELEKIQVLNISKEILRYIDKNTLNMLHPNLQQLLYNLYCIYNKRR